MNEELIHLHTTTSLDANYLENILKDNGISVLIKNEFKSGLSAGFGGGAHENAAQIYVQKDDLRRAKAILKDYLNSTPDQD